MITVADLKDQFGTLSSQRPILKCFQCGNECSAHRGDYFNRPETYPFFCCDFPMKIVIKRTVYEEVEL